MVKRLIIRIDEEKCNGCGLCIPGCAEGALQIIDGKARLVREALCDGLGACLGDCPQGALYLEEAEAEAFDPELVAALLEEQEAEKAAQVWRCWVRADGLAAAAQDLGHCPSTVQQGSRKRQDLPRVIRERGHLQNQSLVIGRYSCHLSHQRPHI